MSARDHEDCQWYGLTGSGVGRLLLVAHGAFPRTMVRLAKHHHPSRINFWDLCTWRVVPPRIMIIRMNADTASSQSVTRSHAWVILYYTQVHITTSAFFSIQQQLINSILSGRQVNQCTKRAKRPRPRTCTEVGTLIPPPWHASSWETPSTMAGSKLGVVVITPHSCSWWSSHHLSHSQWGGPADIAWKRAGGCAIIIPL